MASAPNFYMPALFWANLVVLVAVLVIEVVAIGHCLTRRPDAFGAVGNITKGMWVLMTVAALVWTALFSLGLVSNLFWLGLLSVAVSAVYMLDVRPAIRDALNGRGGW